MAQLAHQPQPDDNSIAQTRIPGEQSQTAERLPLLEIRQVTKRFPGVVANDAISLTVRRGEIHTLLGENGAGKSTFINILSGMLQPEEGEITIDGQPVRFDSPRTAIDHGLGTVYQHFALVPTLSILDNVMLGTTTGPLLTVNRAEQRLVAVLRVLGLTISPRTIVRDLSLGEQQRVEISKALYRGARLLLLDEPTSILSPPEVEELFAILRRLTAEGVAVLFITHKLKEALALSDRLTILRQGRVVGEIGPSELTAHSSASLTQQIIGLMFEEGLPPGVEPLSAKKVGPPICSLARVTALNERGQAVLKEASLELRAGEIVGLAGVADSGQKALAEVIAGQRAVVSGQVTFAGQPITNRGVAEAHAAGIGYVSADRLGEAAIPGLSVTDNVVLKVIKRWPFNMWGFISHRTINSYVRSLLREFKIKAAGPSARLGTLSGGNIQKLLLARELSLNPRLLVCDQPTHGLDAQTAQSILDTLRQRAAHGMAVLLISSEMEELQAVCDRIGVMYEGRLVALLDRAQADTATIGRLMVGGGV